MRRNFVEVYTEMERMKEPFNQSDQIQKMGLTPDEISKPHKVRFFRPKKLTKIFHAENKNLGIS